MALNVQPGDHVRFGPWIRYLGDDAPAPDPEKQTGNVLAVWGICRTSVKVKRDHDGLVVIMFAEDIREIVLAKSAIPSNRFAAAAAGMIPADQAKPKASGSGSRSRKGRSGT